MVMVPIVRLVRHVSPLLGRGRLLLIERQLHLPEPILPQGGGPMA